MQCPVDQTPLNLRVVDGRSLYSCPQCEGQFLSASEVSEVSVNAATQIRLQEKQAFRILRRDGLSLISPCHAVSMHTLFFRGVEIDVCPKCYAVWLDREELQKIVPQVTPGKGQEPNTVACDTTASSSAIAADSSYDVTDIIVDLVEAINLFDD